jgi:hypothetical protein
MSECAPGQSGMQYKPLDVPGSSHRFRTRLFMHAGPFCAACAVGYHKRPGGPGGLCTPCEDVSLLWIRNLALNLFIATFSVGIFFVHFEICFAAFEFMGLCRLFYSLGRTKVPRLSCPTEHPCQI